jgi:histidyl-tRNA synthetase
MYGFAKAEAPLLEDARLYSLFYEQEELPARLLTCPFGNLTSAFRPTQLPGLIRSFVEEKLFDQPGLQKWYYTGPVVEKTSDNKILTDYEFGAEILGQFNHLNEAQVIALAWTFFSSLGLEEISLEVNNLGSLESKRLYTENLMEAILPKKYDLCDDCEGWLAVSPLQMFRCQNLDCQTILADSGPSVLDFLDETSNQNFTLVLESLEEMNIPYQLNPFYTGRPGATKSIFVFKFKSKDKTLILAEGGHRQSFAEKLSGKSIGAFGFNGSFRELKDQFTKLVEVEEAKITSEVCLVPLGDLASKRSLRLFKDLTEQKITVYDHFGQSGVKNQLKIAQTHEVPIALIMGQKEAIDEMVILRDVKSGMQEIISYDKIIDEVKKRLGR